LLYTDGVTEARNPQGEQFGQQRLELAVEASAGAELETFLDHLRGALDAFCDGRPLDDDLTLVAVEAV